MINQIIKNIIKREGGYTDHPEHRKYGVTADTLTKYLGRSVDADDIKKVSKNDANEIIYLQNYQTPKIDQLHSALQEIIMDMSVEFTPQQAIRLFQETLLTLDYFTNRDGLISRVTLIAADDVFYNNTPAKIINALVNSRVAHYEQIIKNDETQRVNLPGWVKRAEQFRIKTP